MFTFLNSSATDLITAGADARSASNTLRVQAVLTALAGSESMRHALSIEIARGGLTVPGFNLLAFITTCDRRSVRRSEIGPSALLSATQVGTTLARLEYSGLVARRRDDTDRRFVWLSLTPAGRERVADVIARCVGGLAMLAAALDERQLRALVAAHQEMHAGIARLLSSPPAPEVLQQASSSFPN